MQLGAVCSPIIDGEVFSFGTTGYTMNNTFVLYDRNTDSVWFPMTDNTFDSVAGPTKGKSLEFLVEPEVMRLHKWARLHPDTLVLLEPPPSTEDMERMAARRKILERVVGTWEMETDLGGRMSEAVMTITFEDGTYAGTWTSMGREMELSNIRFNGEMLRLKREINDGQVIDFSGTVNENTIIGSWTGDRGKLECSGTKVVPEVDEQPATSQPGS